MGFDIRKSNDGALITYPIELPLYDADSTVLARNVQNNTVSMLRHLAVADTLITYLDPDEPVVAESLNQEKAYISSLLVGSLCALASIADNLGIDIMQEIYEVPWEV